MGWTGYYATHYKNGKIDRKAECDAYFMEGLNRGNFKVLKSTMKGLSIMQQYRIWLNMMVKMKMEKTYIHQ